MHVLAQAKKIMIEKNCVLSYTPMLQFEEILEINGDITIEYYVKEIKGT